MAELALWLILDHRGQPMSWLAQQMGVHKSYLSLLRSRKREWGDDLKDRAAQALQVPVAVAFVEVEVSNDGTDG